MPGAARKCQEQHENARSSTKMPGSAAKTSMLKRAHDHHPRWPFVTHPPSRVSTWSRQLALRGRVVNAEKRRFSFSSMVVLPC